MKRYLPIIVAVGIVGVVGYMVIHLKNMKNTTQVRVEEKKEQALAMPLKKALFPLRKCATMPNFLKTLKISTPVMIDLSQKKFNGVALLYGRGFKGVIHPKSWQKYGHFGTYVLDEKGTIYLAPMPFISIEKNTFKWQKSLYKIDTNSGKLSSVVTFDQVTPSSMNPYGVDALTYDCQSHLLWLAAISRSNYQKQYGSIYWYDPRQGTKAEGYSGFDALSLLLAQDATGKKKYLLAGSARDNALYAFEIVEEKKLAAPQKVLTLPTSNLHIRKIKFKKDGSLELQAIPFGYTLVARSTAEDRVVFNAFWQEKRDKWYVHKAK